MSVEINVRGQHTVTLPPERATVHAALTLEGPQPEPVFQAVAAALAEIVSSIDALHHPKKGPITWYAFDQVRMGSRRPWHKDGKQLPLVHSAAVSIAVTFRDFDELARWVSWSAGVDGLSISYVDWALTEAKRLKTERATRQKAVRDAQRRAQDYADALDLGKVVVRGISDPGGGQAGAHSARGVGGAEHAGRRRSPAVRFAARGRGDRRPGRSGLHRGVAEVKSVVNANPFRDRRDAPNQADIAFWLSLQVWSGGWIGSPGAREADDPRSVGCGCLTIGSRRDRVGAATGLFGWVTLAYLAGAVFSWQTFGAGVGPAFFPAAGVTVAAMLLSRRALWPVVVAAIVLAEFAVDLRYGVGWAGALGFAVANSVEPLIGASLVLAWCKGTPDLRRRDHLAFFVAGAAVVGPLVGGMIGGLIGALRDGAWWPSAVLHWWAGDGIGVLVVGAPILLWPRQVHILRDRLLETVIVLLATAGLSVASFMTDLPPALFLLPVMAWAAFRLDMLGAALCGAVLAFVANYMTDAGHGTFAQLDLPAGRATGRHAVLHRRRRTRRDADRPGGRRAGHRGPAASSRTARTPAPGNSGAARSAALRCADREADRRRGGLAGAQRRRGAGTQRRVGRCRRRDADLGRRWPATPSRWSPSSAAACASTSTPPPAKRSAPASRW